MSIQTITCAQFLITCPYQSLPNLKSTHPSKAEREGVVVLMFKTHSIREGKNLLLTSFGHFLLPKVRPCLITDDHAAVLPMTICLHLRSLRHVASPESSTPPCCSAQADHPHLAPPEKLVALVVGQNTLLTLVGKHKVLN